MMQSPFIFFLYLCSSIDEIVGKTSLALFDLEPDSRDDGSSYYLFKSEDHCLKGVQDGWIE